MSKKIVIILSVILGLTVLASAAVIAVMSVKADARTAELEAQVASLTDAEKTLSINVDVLTSAKVQLEIEKKELESRLADAGAFYSDEIASLEAQIAEKAAAISALEADIERYRTVFNIDVREQAQLIDSIVSYIETKCPYVRVYTPIDPETTATLDEAPDAYTDEWVLMSTLIDEERDMITDDAPLFTPEELIMSGLTEEELTEQRLLERVLARDNVRYPSVSIYYEDLSTGYHFDYNADKAYNSASVVKAPYVMSVLEAVANDEKAYLDELTASGELPVMEDTDGDGVADKVKIEYSDPKYDLSEVVVYDKETMFKSGSGVIQTMEDGTEFTYLDFVRYVLLESDNIAYSQLRSRFGYSTMTALANRARVNIAGSTMTARGAGRLFKEINGFIEDNETYGAVMAECMAKANHTVIIPYGVSPSKALHKYGWDEDSYHDAAIVHYGDKPYVLAVFSDLDKGGNEINEYLRGIVKLINKLHAGFYAN